MITQDMIIRDVLIEHPEAEDVFRRHGIGCFG
jgi:Domain of unknown function (DUF1858).